MGSDPGPKRKVAEARDPFDWFYRAVWREEPCVTGAAYGLENARILVLDCRVSGAAIAAIGSGLANASDRGPSGGADSDASTKTNTSSICRTGDYSAIGGEGLRKERGWPGSSTACDGRSE